MLHKMAGKENSQPEELNPKHVDYLKKLDAKANHHLEYNDLKEKLPKYFEKLEERIVGRAINVEFYDDEEDLVATEKVGYMFPSETDNKGKVTKGVSLLGNGLILGMEPRLQSEKVREQFHRDYSPNELPFQIEMHIDRKDKKMSEVADLLRGDCKISVDSDCVPQVAEALDALDNATVFAWNLKKAKERGLRTSSKGAVTIFDSFLKAFDIEPLDNVKEPPKDIPPAPDAPSAK
jgi:hypothetical protein